MARHRRILDIAMDLAEASAEPALSHLRRKHRQELVEALGHIEDEIELHMESCPTHARLTVLIPLLQ